MVHLALGGNHPREAGARSRRERGDVPVHGDHGGLRPHEERGGGLLRDEGGRARLLAEEVVEGLPPAVSDEPLGHDNPRLPCRHELLASDEGPVPRMGAGDFHSIVRILFTSLSHPSRSASHVGSPYRPSYSLSARRTSSGVLPSCFTVRAITFDFANRSSIAIFSSAV